MGIKYCVFLEEGVLDDRNNRYTAYLPYPEEVVREALETQLHDSNKKITGYMYLVPRKEEE